MFEKLQAFLDGYKPSILLSHCYENGFLQKLLPLDYPRLLQYELEDFDDPTIMLDRGTLFFQTESLMEQYLEEMKTTNTYSEEELVLGKYLGFPPIASEYFINCYGKGLLKEKNAGFHYAGIRFAGNIDDTDAICDWLWSNIATSPKHVEVEYDSKVKIIEPTLLPVLR